MPSRFMEISGPAANFSGNLIGSSYSPGKNPAKFDFHLNELSSAIMGGLVLTELPTALDVVS